MGLIAAGTGTMIFLRNSQISTLDSSLRSLVPTDLASTVMEVNVTDGVAEFTANEDAPPTNFIVAVYSPEGTLLEVAGGTGLSEPAVPDTFPLDRTVVKGTEPFELAAVEGSGTFHASVDVLEIEGSRLSYTQLVALPLTSVTQTVANFISIYTVLAALILIAGALGTRALVTLTFRSLGQVEETAMTIATGDFSQRMGDIAPATEVGRLKIAINAMLDRIDTALAERDATVRQMRRFIGDASHELRTPLVTVRGYAELYRMGAITDAENTAQAMERIEKEAMRMGGLVEDLLALARLDERRDLVVAPVDLRPIARDAALDTRASDPERAIDVLEFSGAMTVAPLPDPAETPRGAKRRPTPTRTLATSGLSRLRRRPRESAATGEQPLLQPASSPLAPVVLGDENRIRQVVANLLGNARRYSPAGTPIEIAVGVDGASRMGWISVIDHGEGIPEQLRQKIFQRFWRADTSRTRETGGSGLGLSIVASIVEALHGAIDVQSTPGGGATFRVSFPLADRREAAEHLWIETQPLPRLRPEARARDDRRSTDTDDTAPTSAG
ncbi:sensor histidine kinase [Microbacterium radiodurans]|uniref:histidine kinase n=1 Tax=Microbacterium radiodurans TaxID=661398 RepID=A0A5J5ISQ3_9MICO|nr:HAMP domain-containing sensor histidine kinase [Microbacterium radiodurans]KAA9085384.1 HAMP domain-containing histidine kinase [Microbacterium radiodurans]